MKKAFYPILALLFMAQMGWSQLHISQDVSPETMMMDFFNTDCATVSNVTSDGSGIAYFEGALTDIGLFGGIYLSTGEVYTAIGQNTSEGTSGTTSGTANDPDLQAIATANTVESSIIEMDLVANSDNLSFAYVFASEEYCEYVNSTFNDVFGFFISGPGINGPYENGAINAAMLPDGMPVAINSVNHELNQQYFVGGSNSCGTGPIPYITFDGMTTPMAASVDLVPGETYHVKIGIADVGDGIFDSGVLIGIQSLCGDSLLVPPAQFVVNQNSNGDISIENESKYATSYLWDFGDGFTSTEKDPGNHVYDFSMQNEYQLSLITQNYCCSDTFMQMIMAPESEPVAQFSSDVQEACAGSTIQFNNSSSGTVDNFAWAFPGGTPESSMDENPMVSYDSPGEYDVLLTVSNAFGSHTIEQPNYIKVLAYPTAQFLIEELTNASFDFMNLSQDAESWTWDFGDGIQSMEENPIHTYQQSGDYTVVLTVQNSCGIIAYEQEVSVIISSTNELDKYTSLQLHPNPAKDFISLQGWQKEVSIQAYNHTGQLILSQSLNAGQLINVQDWPRGLYLINIMLDESEIPVVRKVVLD